MIAAAETVLAFWFGASGSNAEIPVRQGKLWFGKPPENDRAVVARFGRFPHRNTLLGRASTSEETEFLKLPGSRF